MSAQRCREFRACARFTSPPRAWKALEHRSVKPEEVGAVFGGARLVEKREPTADAIRRAAIVKDARGTWAACFVLDDYSSSQ